MKTYLEVLKEFGLQDDEMHSTLERELAEEILSLREHLEEDEGVIRVWRGRTLRAEERLEVFEKAFNTLKNSHAILEPIVAAAQAFMDDFYSRHPEGPTTCEYMKALDKALKA